MSSMVPGFGYDIFISYRQKDNKGDRWVTEFVNALKTELEATFKEDISIYFDENPHDGLHENHDVDDSLRDKLKCLIFVPILSRTYCDPKSFAFEHEFKAFVQQATQDQFGLKVKLASGNSAGRVLPVRIHELEAEDVKLFEAEIHAVLRPIDFIFKSTGVNRPLRATEEHPNDNQIKTYYRDQINKVANAIHEIIAGMKQPKLATGESSTTIPTNIQAKAIKKWRFPVIAGAIILFAAFAIWFIINHASLKPASESGLAVLPFTNNSGREDLDFLSVGMASEIRSRLSMSKQFDFISALQSTLSYLKAPKTPKEVGDDLGVDYILSGIYQAEGNRIRVEAEFLDAKSGRLVWSLPIEKELSGIFEMQGEIASEVIKRFSISDQLADEVGGTTNVEAYAAYTESVRLWELLAYSGDSSAYKVLTLLKKAIQLDSGYARAWINLIHIESWQHLNNTNSAMRVASITKSVAYVRSHFPNNWISDLADGFYFYRIVGNFDLALISFNRVLEKDPNNRDAVAMISAIYKRKFQFEKSLSWRKKEIQLAPKNGLAWVEVAIVASDMGDTKNVLKARLKVWDFLKNSNTARDVIWSAIEAGYPLEQLPEELLNVSDTKPDLIRAYLSNEWSTLLKEAKKAKNWEQTAFAFHMLNQHDSATYWANNLLLNEPNNWRMLAIIGETENSMKAIDNYFEHLIRTGNDRQQQCYKIGDQIEAMVLLKDYPEATRLLKKLNDDFPEYQNFKRYFRFGGYDDIKDNYPPFNEVLKNLKRRPIPDVTQFIKFD